MEGDEGSGCGHDEPFNWFSIFANRSEMYGTIFALQLRKQPLAERAVWGGVGGGGGGGGGHSLREREGKKKCQRERRGTGEKKSDCFCKYQHGDRSELEELWRLFWFG